MTTTIIREAIQRSMDACRNSMGQKFPHLVHLLPKDIGAQLMNYYLYGIQPHDLLLNFALRNDLSNASSHSKHQGKDVYAIMLFLFNTAPPACRGSDSDVDDWIRQGGHEEKGNAPPYH